MNNGELLKKTLFMASAMIVALNVSAATDTAKPVDNPYVAGEACDKANDLSTDRNAVVLSCKDRKWVPDGAVWGSQWSHDPMFLLQQAVGDATRSGRQCGPARPWR